MERTVDDPETGCWLWTGARTGKGYGSFERGGRVFRAHRFAYETAVGLADGLHVHHKCFTPLCVNPDHLEALTPAEHIARHGPMNGARDKTHCKHGHPFNEANTYLTTTGLRQCRVCNRDRKRAVYGPPRRNGLCKRGHAMTPENTYRSPRTGKHGGCRVCRLAYSRDRYARQRSEALAENEGLERGTRTWSAQTNKGTETFAA